MDRDRALLSVILAANISNTRLGFNEFFEKARRLPESVRVGSPVTLQEWVDRAHQKGWVSQIWKNQTGRGNKIGYIVTSTGKTVVKDKLSGLFDRSPELELLQRLNIVVEPERSWFVYSDIPISTVLADEELRDKLDELEEEVDEFMEEVEYRVTARDAPNVDLLNGEQRQKKEREYKHFESRLRFLAHRHQYALDRNNMKPYHRMATPSRKVRLFAKSHGIGLNTYGNYDINWDMKDAHALYTETPTTSEYREYKDLNSKWRSYWDAREKERPSPRQLALLFCNYRITKDLLERGRLVEVESTDDEVGRTYMQIENFARQLPDQKLQAAEREFWDAVNTTKYARDLQFFARDEESEEFLGRIDGPDQILRLDSLHAPAQPRKRKVFFNTVHKTLCNELDQRNLEELPRPTIKVKFPEYWIEKESEFHPEWHTAKKIRISRSGIVTIVTVISPAHEYMEKLRRSRLVAAPWPTDTR